MQGSQCQKLHRGEAQKLESYLVLPGKFFVRANQPHSEQGSWILLQEHHWCSVSEEFVLLLGSDASDWEAFQSKARWYLELDGHPQRNLIKEDEITPLRIEHTAKSLQVVKIKELLAFKFIPIFLEWKTWIIFLLFSWKKKPTTKSPKSQLISHMKILDQFGNIYSPKTPIILDHPHCSTEKTGIVRLYA